MEGDNLTQPEVDQARLSEEVVDEVSGLLGCKSESLIQSLEELQKRNEALEALTENLDKTPCDWRHVNGIAVVLQRAEPPDAIAYKILADRYRDQLKSGVVFLAGQGCDGKVSLLVAATRNIVARGFNAGDAVKAMAAEMGGKGGGKADLARGGGTDPLKIPQAFEVLLGIVREIGSGTTANNQHSQGETS